MLWESSLSLVPDELLLRACKKWAATEKTWPSPSGMYAYCSEHFGFEGASKHEDYTITDAERKRIHDRAEVNCEVARLARDESWDITRVIQEVQAVNGNAVTDRPAGPLSEAMLWFWFNFALPRMCKQGGYRPQTATVANGQAK